MKITCILLACLVICLCICACDTEEYVYEGETKSVVVTDENGDAVTDEDGNIVTEIIEIDESDSDSSDTNSDANANDSWTKNY